MHPAPDAIDPAPSDIHPAPSDAHPAPAEFDTEQLEAELVGLAAQINAATCRWLELAAEYERRRAHEACGFASCASWLAWRCSLTPRAAREQLRVARSLAELPLIRAEFASGRLSYSKARALSRVADATMEEDLIELAHRSTAAQLERLLRAYRTATSEDDEIAAERRHLTTWWEDDGTLTVRGSLPADEGALLLKALELAREELFASYVADGRGDDALSAGGEPPAQPNRADALLALAETAIAGGVKAAAGGDRHQVVVHVDVTPRAADTGSTTSPQGDAARERAADATTTPETGPRAAASVGPLAIDRALVGDTPLSPEATRRLACDAAIVTLVEAGGVPLSVGRKTRSIPPAIRRALAARDRCCAFPGCEQERFTDAHHLVHWADGGETSLDNLVLLCRRHHRLVHEGGVRIEGRAGSIRFRRADGTPIKSAPRLPTAAAPARLRRFAPQSPPPWGKGEPIDLDLAVFALADRWQRRRGGDRLSSSRPPPQ